MTIQQFTILKEPDGRFVLLLGDWIWNKSYDSQFLLRMICDYCDGPFIAYWK